MNLGYCICGSFCTFEANITAIKQLSLANNVIPIMSFNAASIDTRFGKAKDFIERIEMITNNKIITTIEGAEPIGPKNMTDIMVVSPCTGNTLAKLANSIVDTPVTMAVKSHLRNSRAVVIGVSTNDALSGAAKNLGILYNLKNYYFVPMKQDNYNQKPTSVVADFTMIEETIKYAMQGVQLQPMLY